MEEFYAHFAKDFFAPLIKESPPRYLYSDSESLLRLLLSDLLVSFIHKHGRHARSFILENDFLAKLFHLFQCRNKFLQLVPVRVLRTALAEGNQDLNNTIINQNLLEPIVVKFIENGSKYNLFNSAVIELFAFIGKTSDRDLLKYYMTNFYERFKDVNYVDTFLELKHKWELIERSEETPDSPLLLRSTNTFRDNFRRKLSEEEEEERWLTSDDEPSSSSASSEPAPTTLSLEAIENELFPALLAGIESQKRKREDGEDSYFDKLRKKARSGKE